MIAKGKSIQHGSNAIDYALKKEHSEVIDKRHIIGNTGKEIKEEFRMFQNLNHRTTNKDMSFVLSPEPNDGNRLTNSDYRKVSDDFLKAMKLDKHQAIVVKHSDKSHTHLHLFVNRIDSQGRAYNDSFVSKQSQTIADKVALENGLTRARNVQAFNKELHKDLRQQLFDKHKVILQHKPRDFKTYCDLMQSSGVKVLTTINKGGNLQGYRLVFNGHNFKASEVHRSMTLSKMGIEKGIGISTNLNPTLKIGFKGVKTIVKGITREL